MIRDSEIIRRINEGDIGQFETLFRSSYLSLVKYAGKLVKDTDSAEEIVQDLFFRLWQDRGKLKIKSSLNGYLFRAVHNKCLHHLEHLRVIHRHTNEVASDPENMVEKPDDVLEQKELQAKIVKILEKLPERCSRIFCMNRFEGLKYAEIAERLSVSVKTVEANMGKALKEFRKALTE